MLANRSEESVMSIPQQAVKETAVGPDPSWRGLYKAGGICAILIFSLVMLKGVFHKSIAYLGIATCAAAFIAMSL